MEECRSRGQALGRPSCVYAIHGASRLSTNIKIVILVGFAAVGALIGRTLVAHYAEKYLRGSRHPADTADVTRAPWMGTVLGFFCGAAAGVVAIILLGKWL